jgi:ubiquinone/menaquinone biosynthesis C-methylase UbiE
MPTVAENVERWQHHEWAKQGDEWSPGRSAAGTAALWWRTLMPRISHRLPTDTLLEIGPGFGRWTQYLRDLSRRVVLVDVTERCIERCRARFAGDPRAFLSPSASIRWCTPSVTCSTATSRNSPAC